MTHVSDLGQEQGMGSTTSSPQEREQRFRDVYDAAYVDLLRFVRRRVHPTHAEDVVGDVMLVAWRRLDDVPADPSAARAWLFGVARTTLQNARRREDRHDAVVLDGLTAPEAAAVLSISSTAFRLRLSRARRTLRRQVDLTTARDPLPGLPASERSPR
jgi:RNA polymerase sigma-70 factor (ECF subfamily)